MSRSVVGTLPDGWRATPLKYLASSSGGMTPSKDRPDFWVGDIPWVSPKDMKQAELDDSTDHVSQTALQQTGLKLHPPGGVMVVVRGMILAHTFPVSRNTVPVTVNQDMKVLRPVDGTDSRYLAWLLQGLEPVMLSMTDESAHGTKALRTDQWANLPVPVPDRSTQERIANLLDEQTARIDALIAEKERLLLALDEFRLSTINKRVSLGLADAPRTSTGDSWFAEVPLGWAFCALNYRYEVQLGKMLDEKRQIGPNPMPYLRNIDVRWDHVKTDALPTMDVSPEERERYTVRNGDLLVCEGGVGVGRAAIWGGLDGTIAYQKALHRVRPRYAKDHPRFLLYLMQDAVWRGRVLGQEKATIPHLTAEAFRRWRFPFPPLDEQRAIARELDEISTRTQELAAHCRDHIDRLREYRSSLISAAVTGQLDIGAYKEAV